MAWQETAKNPWDGSEQQCYTRLGEFHVVDADRTMSARWHRYASKAAFDASRAGTASVLVVPAGQLVISRNESKIPQQVETAEGTLVKQIPMPSYDQVCDGVRLKVVDGAIALVMPDGTELPIAPVAADGTIALFDAVATALYAISAPMFPGATKV